MNKWIISLSSLILFSGFGCAPSMIKMNQTDWNKIKGQGEFQAVHYKQPQFWAVTPERAMVGGLVGVGLFALKGSDMVKEYALEDPALEVKSHFVSSFSKESAAAEIRSVQETLDDDDVDALKKKFGNTVVIDFQTLGWGVRYFSFDWSHYRVDYSARGRLLDLTEPKVIWQGVCQIAEEKTPENPSWDRLVANNASLLKTKLKDHADRCASELFDQLLEKES